MKRVRWRWWGKWAGSAVVVVLVALWAVSSFWTIYWMWISEGSFTSLGMSAGSLEIQRMSGPPSTQILSGVSLWPGNAGMERIPTQRWMPIAVHWDAPMRSGWMSRDAELPVPLIARPFAATALLLFHADRRISPGHCPHCRYDLSG